MKGRLDRAKRPLPVPATTTRLEVRTSLRCPRPQAYASTIVDSTIVESFDARARAFKALGEPTRLRILAHLQAGECCACEVQEALDVPANLLSHHLKVLREAGLVTGTRRGRWIDYRVVPDQLELLASVLATVAERPKATCRATDRERTVAA